MNKLFIFALSNIQPGSNLPQIKANQSELQLILQLFFGVIGALGVLFVVIGGFRYIISAGDATDASKAKMTIIYASVGLLLAVAGETLVTWALGRI